MADVDDDVRCQTGVVACLREMGNGTSKLILDDVASDSAINPISWRFESFYSWHDYSNEDLGQRSLSDGEYQMIGQALIARLLALNGRAS